MNSSVLDSVAVPSWVDCDFVFTNIGDSMVLDRILDGDIVCVKAQLPPKNDQIAVVQVDGGDYLLRRVHFSVDGGIRSILLEPGNFKYASQFFVDEDADRVGIIGYVTHLISAVR